MSPSARQVALLALLAFVPVAAYGFETGEFTTVIAAMGVLNLLLIAASLVTLFSGSSGGEDLAEPIS